MKTLYIFSLLIFLSLTTTVTSSSSTIGITYSPPPPNATSPPPPSSAVISTLITTTFGFTAVRLPDSDPTLTRSFSYTNTSLLLSIPNSFIQPFAANRSLALRYIYTHVLPFYPRAKITLISIGNDVFDTQPDVSPFLLPAIRNLHLSLRELGIRKIAVSSTFSFLDVVTTSFPPSNAEFRQPAGDTIIKPLLQFIEETNSSFLVNIYPYNVYRLNSEIPLGFALFQEHPFNFRDDIVTGVRYRNLFDMMVDAVISAMAVAGHENIPVVVAETGWPSCGDDTEMDANLVYAEMYLRGLVNHLKSGIGTPLRKEGVKEAYIYDLVDHCDHGKGRNWGILYRNLTNKYKIQYASSSGGGVTERGVTLILVLFILLGNMVMANMH